MMEKNILYVFYNLCMMSLYNGLGIVRPIVLSILSIVYISIIFVVGYRVHKLWNTDKTEGSERITILSWQMIWGLLILLFLLRDLQMINEISFLCAFVLLIVMISTIISSCYVIMMDSKFWTEQMFMVSALHWVVFHDAEAWLAQTPHMLVIPIVCMSISRVIHCIELEKSCRFEICLWILMIVLEALYSSKIIEKQIMFMICSLCYFVIMVTNNNRFVIFLILTIPIFIPTFTIFCMVNVYRFGWMLGLEKSYNIFINKWRKTTGQDFSMIELIEQTSDDVL